MTDINELLAVMKTLRDPQKGCPWDREQDFLSLLPHTLEEVYEVLDAVERNNHEDVCDELGDLLFQVVFYAQIAEEAGDFDFQAIVEGIVAKLLRRHPHVFADELVGNAEQQADQWEEHKAKERSAKKTAVEPESALDGVALTLPALIRSVKLQRRAARVGFDWAKVAQVLDKVEEELAELREEIAPLLSLSNDQVKSQHVKKSVSESRIEHELGDLLQAVTNLSRHLDIEPESALRRANQRFEKRFQRVEALCREESLDIAKTDLTIMESFWDKAKSEGL